MIYIVPIIAALFFAGLTIGEKIVLRKRKIEVKFFQVAAFLGAVVTMIPFLFYFWKLDPVMFEVQNLLIFAVVILSALFANWFMFYAIKWEKISNIEPALIMEPLFTVLLAVVFSFFTVGLYERNMGVIIPAIIAGLALIFSHIKKHHLSFNKYFIAALLGAFFFSLELVISRLILSNFTPISFYFVRSLAVMFLSILLFRPKIPNMKTSTGAEIFLVGAFWVVYRVLIYWGYLNLGVIFTTLIVMLGPIFVYFLAWKLLKEKIGWRNIVASVVILACVVYVVLF